MKFSEYVKLKESNGRPEYGSYYYGATQKNPTVTPPPPRQQTPFTPTGNDDYDARAFFGIPQNADIDIDDLQSRIRMMKKQGIDPMEIKKWYSLLV